MKGRGFTMTEMVIGIVAMGIVMVPAAIMCSRFVVAANRVGELALAREYMGNNIEAGCSTIVVDETTWATFNTDTNPRTVAITDGTHTARVKVENRFGWAIDNNPPDDSGSYFEDWDYLRCSVPSIFYRTRNAAWGLGGWFNVPEPCIVWADYLPVHDDDNFVHATYNVYRGTDTSAPKILGDGMHAYMLRYVMPEWIHRYSADIDFYMAGVPKQSQTLTFTRFIDSAKNNTYACTTDVGGGAGLLKSYLAAFFERRGHFGVYSCGYEIDNVCPVSPWHYHKYHIHYRYLNPPRVVGIEMNLISGQQRTVEEIRFIRQENFPAGSPGTADWTSASLGTVFWPSTNTPRVLPPGVTVKFPNPMIVDNAYELTYPDTMAYTFAGTGYNNQGVPNTVNHPNNIGRDIAMQIRFSPLTGVPDGTHDSQLEIHIIFSDGSELGGWWRIRATVSGGSETSGSGAIFEWRDLVLDTASDSYWFDSDPPTADPHNITTLR